MYTTTGILVIYRIIPQGNLVTCNLSNDVLMFWNNLYYIISYLLLPFTLITMGKSCNFVHLFTIALWHCLWEFYKNPQSTVHSRLFASLQFAC